MQIERSFSYQFEDPHWVTKLGIGALISVIPVLNLAIVGYMVELIRNVARNAADPLPTWEDLGSKFRDGLVVTVVALIYASPALIMLCLPLALLASAGVVTQNSNLVDMGHALAGAGGVLLFCFLIVVLVYSLILSVIRPIVLVIFSRDGTFASCFRLREIYEVVSKHPRPFFITWVAVIIAGIAMGLVVGFVNLVVGWVPCMGWIAGLLLAVGTGVYLLTVDAHLFGQFRVQAFGAADERKSMM